MRGRGESKACLSKSDALNALIPNLSCIGAVEAAVSPFQSQLSVLSKVIWIFVEVRKRDQQRRGRVEDSSTGSCQLWARCGATPNAALSAGTTSTPTSYHHTVGVLSTKA